MKKFIYIAFFVLITQVSFGQLPPDVVEDSLKNIFIKLRMERDEAKKELYNRQAITVFRDHIGNKDAFEYPFESLSNFMGNIQSPDGVFRIFNWNIETIDRSQKYYCFIVKESQRGNQNQVIELKDLSSLNNPGEFKTLQARQWFGALYYKIIPVEGPIQTYYTVLGWDGNDTQTSRRIIDVIGFSGNKVQFGYPIFNTPKGLKKRYVIEFSAQASITMEHRKKTIKKKDKLDLIVFNHVVPVKGNLEGHYEYYYPDMSYDAFKLEEGKWHFISDYDARANYNSMAHPDYDKQTKVEGQPSLEKLNNSNR